MTNDPDLLKEAMEEYQKKARDNARTPMQWDSRPHGGFTSSETEPWMTANPNFAEVNVTSQINDPASPFAHWKSLLAARKKYKDVLVYGDFKLVDAKNEKIFAYTRTADSGEGLLVICNFSDENVEWRNLVTGAKAIILSNYERKLEDVNGAVIALEAYEAMALLV